MNMPLPALIVAGLMSLLTWAVVHKALREHPTLGNPILPPCVAGLSFLGLTMMGSGLIYGILLLYAALAIAILLMLLFNRVSAGGFPRRDGGSNTVQKRSQSDLRKAEKNADNSTEGLAETDKSKE